MSIPQISTPEEFKKVLEELKIFADLDLDAATRAFSSPISGSTLFAQQLTAQSEKIDYADGNGETGKRRINGGKVFPMCCRQLVILDLLLQKLYNCSFSSELNSVPFKDLK